MHLLPKQTLLDLIMIRFISPGTYDIFLYHML